MPSAPPEAAVARFRSDLTRLAGGVGPFGVAVSGGPDSLALLLLCAEAFPQETYAATVDHGLRPASASEAAFVALLCSSMGVPHMVLVPSSAPDGNLQDWARRERYAALHDWARDRQIGFILTGHHADDQLETIIMRLNRGSGVSGLAGVRARQGKIVRPLLDWRKSELAALVYHAGLAAVDDPSNTDARFDRARLRSALTTADWLDARAASRSAQALADAELALTWAAARWFEDRATHSESAVALDADGLPDELVRRVTRLALRSINPDADPRGADISRLIAALKSGQSVTLAEVWCTGGPPWQFRPAPQRRKN